MQWDEEALYLNIRVDDNARQTDSGGNYWNDDFIELLLHLEGAHEAHCLFGSCEICEPEGRPIRNFCP